MMDIKDKYLEPFLDEAGENIQKLNECLLAFEQGNQSVIDEIFRVAHTLKGMSATMGFQNMTHLTHAMEDVLDGARKELFQIQGKDDISILFECLDVLNVLLMKIRESKDDSGIDTAPLAEKLAEIVSSFDEENTVVRLRDEPDFGQYGEAGLKTVEVRLKEHCQLKGARAFMVLEEITSLGKVLQCIPPERELFEGAFEGDDFYFIMETEREPADIEEAVMRVGEVLSCKAGNASNHEKQKTLKKDPETKETRKKTGSLNDQLGANQTIRVDVHRLDKLMNLVGELVIGRSRIERLTRDRGLKEFEEPMLLLGRISMEIQELVTKLRMLPIRFIFDRFPRLVRDISRELGKKVNLQIDGRETELDRSVIDEIGDPMVHLIRNSLDHGIETPKERMARGKSETGLLRVRAYQDGSSVVIAVEDDGHGIDRELVIKKALEKGLVSEEQADNMSDRDVYQILYLPGFSTSENVTDLSGRGVGMDALKTKVEALGGRITIESAAGKGTSVKVKLPITLAIVLALLVRIDDRTYAIPLESVDETLKISKSDIKNVNGSLATQVRGAILPLIDSRSYYGLSPREEEEGEYEIVIVRTGFRKVGFIVDEFVGQQEIVIKSFGDTGLTKIKWFSGGTILGDGSVALIIDPSALED